MSDKPDIPDEATDLFRAAVADVRRLAQDKVVPAQRRPRPHPRQTLADEQQVLAAMLSDPPDHADVEIGEELLFSRTGLQHAVLRKLRRGQFSLEAELDLHGFTVTQAKQAIVEFLDHCSSKGLRCVRVIHGKGRGSPNRLPVLKSHTDHWLRQRDEVLAFCSARPVDGGTGAVYVLLRRSG